MEKQEIKVTEIIVDNEIQSRTGLNEQFIKEYLEDIKEGAQFPPVDLFFDGKNHFLTDGFHRFEAFKKAGNKTIPAVIHKGDRREALLYSVGVNAQHGIRRTNDDKRKAVRKLLMDDEWSQWSDGEIARRCAVSQPFVTKVRDELTQNGYESPSQRKGGDGRTIDTSNIGKDPKSPEEQAPSEEGSDKGTDENQAESAEVEMEFSEKTDSPKPKKASESSSGEDADDEGKKGEDSEEDTEDLLPKIKGLITDLLSGLIEVNKMLPQKGDLSQNVKDSLEKPLEKLNSNWTQFISNMDDVIED